MKYLLAVLLFGISAQSHAACTEDAVQENVGKWMTENSQNFLIYATSVIGRYDDAHALIDYGAYVTLINRKHPELAMMGEIRISPKDCRVRPTMMSGDLVSAEN